MKNTELDPLAQNIKMLAHWDGEGLIRSISMGGMGDSYEMPIQLLIVESLRRAIDEGLPDLEALSTPALNEWAEYSIDRVFRRFKGSGLFDGMSGAQAGASKQVLYQASLLGWFSMVETIPQGRLISVGRDGRIVHAKL